MSDDGSGFATRWHRRPGPLVEAGLVVGVGVDDETLPTHGFGHLTEHLARGACRQLAAFENAFTTCAPPPTRHTAPTMT